MKQILFHVMCTFLTREQVSVLEWTFQSAHPCRLLRYTFSQCLHVQLYVYVSKYTVLCAEFTFNDALSTENESTQNGYLINSSRLLRLMFSRCLNVKVFVLNKYYFVCCIQFFYTFLSAPNHFLTVILCETLHEVNIKDQRL